MRLRIPTRQFGATMVGALLAAAVCDIALRPFATGLRNEWHALPLQHDSMTAPETEVRYFREGIATAHFSPVHARLTGTPAPRDDAPEGVILGDSYVEALQVNDEATTGAVVERLAQHEGRRVRVRQYGWSGAALSQYLRVAPQIIARWAPRWVAIVVNSDDLTESAAATGPFDFPPTEPRTSAASGVRGRVEQLPRAILSHSPLAYELMLSALKMAPHGGGGLASDRPPDLTTADVRATVASAAFRQLQELRDAFGARLTFVYVGQIPADPSVTVDSTEKDFLRACVAAQVRCVGTADAMLAARDQRHDLARGFTNSVPGRGHPNTTGHRLLGEALWRAVRRDEAR